MVPRVQIAFWHVIALALFVHGFLLTRVHLPKDVYFSAGLAGGIDGPSGLGEGRADQESSFDRSSAATGDACEPREPHEPHEPHEPPKHGKGHPEDETRPSTAPYKKLVWIVVDALRYDFVVDDARYGYSKRNVDMPFLSSFVMGPACSQSSAGTGPETDKDGSDGDLRHPCQVTDAIASARVARFVADAPTTTTQRLTSMTTGSLPVFFDVSSAFSASAVSEDNLIDRLKASGKRMVFMGDSTWDGLYPTQFDVSYPFPCYNIMDLHSVDDGVDRHLMSVIRNMTRNTTDVDWNDWNDWDVVVAHYLGVDHAGHAYGVESPQMRAKLRQIDQSIRDVVSALRSSSDTLVLVVGDHGQTLTGDHGGGGPEEVDSVLVAIDVDAYYGRKRNTSVSGEVLDSTLRCMRSCTCGEDGNQCVQDVTQIDLVPTLAGLVGIPIPYVNLGKVSAEIWSLVGAHWNSSFGRMLRENALQVHRYLDTYAKQPGARLPAGDMQTLNERFAALSSRSDPESYLDFLSAAEGLARRAWTQFHDGWMVAGCLCAVGTMTLHGAMLFKRLANVRESTQGTWRGTLAMVLPWMINMIHPIGIFSFFFLLSEGTYTSWIVVLTAASVFWPKRHHPRATTGLVLTCAACVLISVLGLQSHSGFGFWQRLTVHDDVVDVDGADGRLGEDGGTIAPSVGIAHEALMSPALRLTVHYVIPTAILAYIFYAYVAARCLFRGVEKIYPAYLAAGTIAMLAYQVVTAAGQHAHEDASDVEHADGYIPAQICYAFIGALVILCTGARIGKRLSPVEFLVVLCTTVALLVALISPISTPLVILGLFAEVYGMHMMCTVSSIERTEREERMALAETSAGATQARHDVADDEMLLPFMGCLAAIQTQAFYVSGHLCEFSGLIFTAAFVGQQDYDMLKAGLLLGFDTCGCMVLVIVIGALLLQDGNARENGKYEPCNGLQATGRAGAPPSSKSKTRASSATHRSTHIAGHQHKSRVPGSTRSRTHTRSHSRDTDRRLPGSHRHSVPSRVLLLSRSASCCAAMVSAGIQRRHLYAWALFAPKFVFEAYFCIVTDIVVLALGVLV